MKTLKSSLIYFLLVFGAGFALGVVRLIWIVPRFGARTAELLEMPLMLLISLGAAHRVTRHFSTPDETVRRLVMGGLSLIFLLLSESVLTRWARGISFQQYLADKDPVSGTAYGVSLAIFALMPVFVNRNVRLGVDNRRTKGRYE